MNKKLWSLVCTYTLGVVAVVAVTVKGIRSIADLKTEEGQ
jgi:hypothetical protein